MYNLLRVSQSFPCFRYNIPRQLKCEDDHVKCMQVMIEFVSDHIRMPITHVDTGMFHSHQK